MFQIMINDSWKEIVRPLQQAVSYATAFFICYLILHFGQKNKRPWKDFDFKLRKQAVSA
jgi:hypothetical protein